MRNLEKARLGLLFCANCRSGDEAAPAPVKRIGTDGDDDLRGSFRRDEFDGGGGNDDLRGGPGNDVYWLGRGSGRDTAHETAFNKADKAPSRTYGDDCDVIKIKTGISPSKVALSRSEDGADLHVNLLDDNGEVTDSLIVNGHFMHVAAQVERIEFADGTVWDGSNTKELDGVLRGWTGNDNLNGARGGDVFDGSAGGNDVLRGNGGDDVYWLGYGAERDSIVEFHGNDKIRVKKEASPAMARLYRRGEDLHVELMNAAGKFADSLVVRGHYADKNKSVEKVEFALGGTVWGANEFAAAGSLLVGAGGDSGKLRGGKGNDIFDSDGGGDAHELRGGAGDDEYWLGAGSGHDTIIDGGGDAGDAIRVKAGYGAADVELGREGDDLHVRLMKDGLATDSLKVSRHYGASGANRIERIEFADGTFWGVGDFEVAGRLHVGGAYGDNLYGDAGKDVFDGDAGGNDWLYGYGGDDVYWLGSGTGDDIIREHYKNKGDDGDVIRLKSGYGAVNTRLVRSNDGVHLYVYVVDAEGKRTDSLKVDNYYSDASARVEHVEFADGKTPSWGAKEFALAEIVGGAYGDNLYGRADWDDVFDGDAGGNDWLYGYGGDDVYWLGSGTGDDIIREHYRNDDGDDGDVIRLKSGYGATNTRLVRSNDGVHLYVYVVDEEGERTDSLKVDNYYADASARVERVEFADGKTPSWGAKEFALAEVVGSSRGDNLYGRADWDDVFDGDAGGNDVLYGYGGDDVYWLGAGTGDDIIREHYRNDDGDDGDVIRLKSGYDATNTRLVRSNDGVHLYVYVVNEEGERTDSLKVDNYYADASARVEHVEFADGKTPSWGAKEFALAEIVGGAYGDNLYGRADWDDVFDGDAGGNDVLYGYGGDDVYWLGSGTGADVIREHYRNDDGDDGDVIRLKSGYGAGNTRLVRSGDGLHLHVYVVDESGKRTDSLKVENYYSDASARVEHVEFADGKTPSWGAKEFALAEIVGGSRGETLDGGDGWDDVFDGDAGGNDVLRGYGGDDVYWLGAGTGDDIIREHYRNDDGDDGDVIRLKSGYGAGNTRLVRSNDGVHLYVYVVDESGKRTDSLKVDNYYSDASARVEHVEFADGKTPSWGAKEFALAEIVGSSRGDNLYGRADWDDVFDGDAGGNDWLYGYGGDDVYWLGSGTGADVIREHQNNKGDDGDVIRLKSGYGAGNTRLVRSNDGVHLYVYVVDEEGERTDSLKVDNYYADASARVEHVEFADGKTPSWGAKEFALAEIVGSSRGDNLYGRADWDDVFDGDAGGNDWLYGYGGDDVYWLGSGTGADVIREHYKNKGDDGDAIKVKADIALSSVRLARSGKHLLAQLADGNGKVTDSLKVENHFSNASAKIERIEAGGKALLATQFQALIDAMAVFSAGNSDFDSVDAVYAHYWKDADSLTTPT